MVPPLRNTGELGVAGGVDLMGKKKRGRPRKYDSDGNLKVPFVKSPPSESVTPPPGFISPRSSDFSSSNKSRGRPTGSGNWQLLSSFGELFAETAGGDFTPHVVNVYTGEDVAGKILSIIQRGPRGICILAANGAVSNVTIRQPGLSGGILTYEGRFEILSLTGSFTIAENGGVKSRTGGLSVCLAGPDGRVIGGGIAGLLTAASPIQIVVGSFAPNDYMTHKRKHGHQYEPISPPPRIFSPPNVVPPTSPITRASSIVNNAVRQNQTTPLPIQNHQGSDSCINQNSTPLYTTATGADPSVHQRAYPDINVTALFE